MQQNNVHGDFDVSNAQARRLSKFVKHHNSAKVLWFVLFLEKSKCVVIKIFRKWQKNIFFKTCVKLYILLVLKFYSISAMKTELSIK